MQVRIVNGYFEDDRPLPADGTKFRVVTPVHLDFSRPRLVSLLVAIMPGDVFTFHRISDTRGYFTPEKAIGGIDMNFGFRPLAGFVLEDI